MGTQEFNEDLVSVITPMYNCEKYIIATIKSVLCQTYSQWEMILVDDGSTDNTLNIIREYEGIDSRIKVITLQSNQGVSNARNVAINNSKGRFIAFLDSDDIWLPHKLERQISFMKKNKISFSYSQYRHFTKDVNNFDRLIDVPAVVDYKQLLKGNIIPCLTVIIDISVIPQFKMPKERHEDYITWLSILKRGYKAYAIKEDLARYRLSETSITSNKIKSALWTWRIYRNIEKKSLLKSIYYFICYLLKGLKKHRYS